MIVQHNMAALNANRMLGIAGKTLAKSTEKLSSGYRVNRAADDAAGLAISEKMRGQIRGLNRASSNAQDGITLIQTAEGALNETQNILQRMRELAVQAANDTNTTDDRAEIQKEINQLTSEINRIGNTTEYNTMKLLKGNTKDAVVSGLDVDTLKDAEVVAAQGTVSEINVKQASTIGKASTTIIQANSSKTLAAFKDPALSVEGIAGAKASTTFAGLTFTAKDYGIAYNDIKITISYDASVATSYALGASATNAAGADKDLKLVLGTKDMQEILDAGIANDDVKTAATLMSKLNGITVSLTNAAATSNAASWTTGDPSVLASEGIVITQPENEATAKDLSITIEGIKNGTDKSSTTKGGVEAKAAEYKLSMLDMAREIDDTITIAGTTLVIAGKTDVLKNAVGIQGGSTAAATVGTWTVGTSNEISAVVSTSALTSSNFVLDGDYKVTVSGSSGSKDITITDANGTVLASTSGIASGVSSAAGAVNVGDFVVTLGTSANNVDTATVKITGAARTQSKYQALVDVFNANNDKFTMSIDTSNVTGGVVDNNTDPSEIVFKFVEKNKDVSGKTTVSDFNVQAKGNGTDDYIVIKDKNGQNLVQFNFTPAGTNTAQPLAVTSVTGSKAKGDVVVTIQLSSTKGENTAEAIQNRITDLAKTSSSFLSQVEDSGIDFKEFTVEAFGKWDMNVGGYYDNATVGGADTSNAFVNKWNSTAGGVETKKGKFEFDVTNSFAAGDELVIAGKTFVAAKEADLPNGVFATGVSTKEQAENILLALRASDSLMELYNVDIKGTTLILEEINASGKNLANVSVEDGASVKGEFSTKLDTLVGASGSFTIDGETIAVSNKNEHVGYANGTAIKAAGTLEDQTAALAEAINKNAVLSAKYNASVGEDGSLKLTQVKASNSSLTITTSSATEGSFDVKLQIGANTGQGMVVSIGDTRALALGVSGDGSTETVKANNGVVATYTKLTTVNSGSDNDNVEYALDVSSHEKATNALSVLDDALNAISSQRASLGAYQNRLEHTIANLDNTSENLQTAESSIRDVNMASEMVNFSKSNIIQQAAQSMLAQANQQTQGVLSLLR